MNKQEKIDTIYKKIAYSKLSFGCKIANEDGYFIVGLDCKIETIYAGTDYEVNYCCYGDKRKEMCEETDTEIIGHPVLFQDIFFYIYLNDLGNKYIDLILDYWRKPRRPIEEQSEECIDFIYNLIKD